MNEELKIKITANVQNALQNVKKVGDNIAKVGTIAGKASAAVGKAMVAIGKTMAKAVAAGVAAVSAFSAAVAKLGKDTLEFRKQQAQLATAYQAMGSSAEQATKTYTELFSFLGETDTATEAANLLAQITTNEQDLAEWTNTLMGVYATFPDSLPIESLVEASNETIKTGTVTGALADAVNWTAGAEEALNAALAKTNSQAEREALIRETLNSIYGDAAALYAENNSAIIAYQQSQAKLDAAMARAGNAAQPLLTAINNLGVAFFNVLAPALNTIVPILERFINAVSSAVTWVGQLFGLLGTGGSAITGMSTAAAGATQMASGVANAAKGATNLVSGLSGVSKGADAASQQIDDLKKKTEGFDELNIVSSGSTAASSGGGGSLPTGGGGGGGGSLQGALEQANTAITKPQAAIETVLDNIGATIQAKLPTLVKKGMDVVVSIVKGISKALPAVVDTIAEILPIVVEGLVEATNAITNELPALITSIVDGIMLLIPALIEGIISITSAVIEALPQIIETIVTALPALIPMLINGIVTLIVMLCESFSSILQPIIDALPDVIISVVDALMSNLPALIGGIITLVLGIVNAIPQILQGLIDAIPTIISSIIEGLLGALPQLIMGLIEVALGVAKALPTILLSVYTSIINIFVGIWEGVGKAFGNVGQWFKDKFGEGAEGIKNAFGAVGQWFVTKRNEIFDAFKGVGDWFGKTFTYALNAIKRAFSSVTSFFSDVWTSIKNIFSKVGTTIGSAITDTVKKAVNGVLSVAVKIINGFIKAINVAIGVINAIPGVNIKKLKELDVPKLAKGGIIDSATLAVIGERGKEAVVPLENNTEWMDKLIDRLVERRQTPTKIVLMVGKKELGEATIDSINDITRQTGTLQLQLI